jgi:hypothetical protein
MARVKLEATHTFRKADIRVPALQPNTSLKLQPLDFGKFHVMNAALRKISGNCTTHGTQSAATTSAVLCARLGKA